MKSKTKVLIVVICYCLFSITQTIGQTICFDLNITDNCGTPWSGKYSASVSVYMNNELKCSHTFYNLGLSSSDLSFECTNLPLNYTQPVYEIKVDACRTQTPPTCCGHGTSGAIYYSDLTDCDTGIDVTIE
jgi:hypothetical protein